MRVSLTTEYAKVCTKFHKELIIRSFENFVFNFGSFVVKNDYSFLTQNILPTGNTSLKLNS